MIAETANSRAGYVSSFEALLVSITHSEKSLNSQYLRYDAHVNSVS